MTNLPPMGGQPPGMDQPPDGGPQSGGQPPGGAYPPPPGGAYPPPPGGAYPPPPGGAYPPPPGGTYPPPPGGTYPPPPGGTYPPPPGGAYQPPPGGGPGGVYLQPGSYAPSPPPQIRPGRIWYLVALVIFAGATAWLIFSVVALVGTINDLQRVPLPAGGTVSFERSGGYTVYYEGPGSQSGNIPPFDINVAPVSPGAQVSSLTPYELNVTYNFGSHNGRAVFTLDITNPGTFRITANGPQVTGAGLAVGDSIASGIVGILLPAVPLMFLAFLGAVLVLVLRFIRKRALRYAPREVPPT